MTTEIQKIKEQFAEVIRHSQNIPNPQLDKLFDNWFNAKERIIRYSF